MRTPGRGRDLVLDQRVDGFGIWDSQKRLCQAHQRDPFAGRQPVFGQEGLHQPGSPGRPDGVDMSDRGGRCCAQNACAGPGLGHQAVQRGLFGHAVARGDLFTFCGQGIHGSSLQKLARSIGLVFRLLRAYLPDMSMNSVNLPDQVEGLDPFDQKIVAELARNGRLPVTELARRVGLSKSPTQVRVRRLEAEGFILGYRAVLNPEKLAMDHVAFVEVRLGDTREAALAEFNAAVAKIPEIEQCHMIAGAFDYLLKVRSADIHGYRQVLGMAISTLPHVVQTSTHVAMQAVLESGF